jgi:cell shape-determining protein MreD
VRPRVVFALAVAAVLLRWLMGLWSPLAAYANPLLAITIVATLPGLALPAMGVGIATGLAQDVWTGRWFGQHAFAHLVVAYLLSLVSSRMDMVGWVPAAIALLVGSLVDWGILVGLSALFDRRVAGVPGPGAWAIMALANVAIGLVFFALARERSPQKKTRR